MSETRTGNLLLLMKQVFDLEAERDMLARAIREHDDGVMHDCYIIGDQLND